MTLVGTGFSGTPEFLTGLVKQTVKVVNDTNIIVSITNVNEGTFNASKIYFEKGNPDGAELIAANFSLTPKLMEVSPSSGSAGGSLITAVVPGVGIKTKNIDLVDATGASICQKVTIVSYGQVQCLTKAQVIVAASEISLK